MSLGVVASVDLNKAHEQAMDLLAKLGAKQERKLICFLANRTTLPMFYYESCTFSEKCHPLRGADGSYGDVIPRIDPSDPASGKVSYIAWEGHQRIAAVASVYLDATPDLSRYDAQMRPFARSILVFRCYSLVSRHGNNDIAVTANAYQGAIAPILNMRFNFDLSRNDGGMPYGNAAQSAELFPLLKSAGENVLQDGERAEMVRQFAESSWNTAPSARRQSMSDHCTAIDGRQFEISASISGRFDCITDIEVRARL